MCKAAAMRKAVNTEVCRVVLISPREVWENFFTFIFQISGWALVAPLCFALQVPDLKGLQDGPGPPCMFLAQISLTQRPYTYT